jgi:hypothetical protein
LERAALRFDVLHLARLAFVSLAFLLACLGGAEAQFGVPLNHTDPKLESVEARELVARYCRFDYAGARLNPADWPKLQPLVSWTTNPEFPLMMVTSRFDLDHDAVLEHGKYSITVHYRLVGRYDMTEGYSSDGANTVQNVQFVVAEVNGDWRITEVEPSYPHPSRASALQWLNKRLSEAPDPASKLTYQHAVQDLQLQKVSPTPQ